MGLLEVRMLKSLLLEGIDPFDRAAAIQLAAE